MTITSEFPAHDMKLSPWQILWLKIAGIAVVVAIPFVTGFVVGCWIAGDMYKPEFFQLAAEVIPIFILALVVDLKSLRLKSDDWRKTKHKGLTGLGEAISAMMLDVASFATAAIGILVVVAGEIVSLLVVGDGEPSGKWQQGFVLGACFTGLAMVAARGISIRLTSEPGRDSGRQAPDR